MIKHNNEKNVYKIKYRKVVVF